MAPADESEILIQHPRSPLSQNEPGQPLTSFSLFLTLFAALGGFLFGYDTGVISGAMILIKDQFQMNAFWQELIVSVTIGSAIFGALFGGYLNERLGRKPVLIISAAVFTGGAVIVAVARSREVLLVGRLVIGFGIGGASMSVPVYVAETSPSHLRGRLVTLNNIFITGGQFIASVVDGLFSEMHQGWRCMLGLAAVPSLIMFIGCLLIPESPRWLVSHGSADEARRVLVKIRDTEEVDEEFQEMKDVVREETQLQQERGDGVLLRMLTLPRTRKALIVGCGLQAVQQLVGINTVMYYGATVILMSGIGSKKTVIWLAALVAFINFLFSWVGMYLIDRVGRRKLLLASLAGVIISLLLLGAAFYLFQTHDPSVNFKEASAPANLQAMCGQRDSCMECVKTGTCGFCYAVNKEDQEVNGSCVYVNTSADNAAAYGRCSAKGQYNFKWNRGACPSQYAWLAVLGLSLYIACFAPGMGPVPWTLNSEIYPLWARTAGSSCATAMNWSLNLLVSMTFLSLIEWISAAGAFWLYMSVAILGWIFFFCIVPETKGKSLEQLETLFL